MSNSRKKIIFVFLVCVFLLSVSLKKSYEKKQNIQIKTNIQQGKKEENEKIYLQNSLNKIEEANSALIYKDYEKALNLLQEGKKEANKISSLSDLFNDAKNNIVKIENLEKQVSDLRNQEKEKN